MLGSGSEWLQSFSIIKPEQHGSTWLSLSFTILLLDAIISIVSFNAEPASGSPWIKGEIDNGTRKTMIPLVDLMYPHFNSGSLVNDCQNKKYWDLEICELWTLGSWRSIDLWRSRGCQQKLLLIFTLITVRTVTHTSSTVLFVQKFILKASACHTAVDRSSPSVRRGLELNQTAHYNSQPHYRHGCFHPFLGKWGTRLEQSMAVVTQVQSDNSWVKWFQNDVFTMKISRTL